LILSRCCSQIRFFRLLVIFRQKWVSINRVGFLLCLRFWLWHSLWNQRVQHPRWWSFQLRFWRRFTYLLLILILNARLILSRCCSQIRFFRLPIIFLQKLISIDQVGFLLCLESWLWHSLLNRRVQHPRWWSFQLRFWRRFTFVRFVLFKFKLWFDVIFSEYKQQIIASV